MRTKVSTRERRRIGRPPAGARAGEKVTDYPQVSIRLPVEIKAKLQAISAVAARPQWRVVAEAIEDYLRDRPESERRMVDELSRVRSSRPRRGKRRRG
jgi:predicted DNA-binding protein